MVRCQRVNDRDWFRPAHRDKWEWNSTGTSGKAINFNNAAPLEKGVRNEEIIPTVQHSWGNVSHTTITCLTLLFPLLPVILFIVTIWWKCNFECIYHKLEIHRLIKKWTERKVISISWHIIVVCPPEHTKKHTDVQLSNSVCILATKIKQNVHIYIYKWS